MQKEALLLYRGSPMQKGALLKLCGPRDKKGIITVTRSTNVNRETFAGTRFPNVKGALLQ